MIKENKKYSGEELKKVLDDAVLKAIELIEKDFDEANKGSNKENNSLARLAFTMQNMLAIQTYKDVLLGRRK